jgi:uncharacterized protein (TIGR02453 family)
MFATADRAIAVFRHACQDGQDRPAKGGIRAMPTTTETFTGFRREAIQFLADLAANNDRSWFTPRKAEFERLLKEPLEAMCVALDERFQAREIPLRADVRSPFRIYRDVRFSKDKSPYKTNVGASFAYTEGHANAGGYFHFQPGEMYIGGGMWHPEPARLAAWRAFVDRGVGLEVLDDAAFVKTFDHVSGDRLTRVPQGFPKDHPRAELLKLKDVTFGRRLSDDEALSPDLPDILAADFAAAVPVFRMLGSLPD